MNTYPCKKYWFLGFLGFIGFFELTNVVLVFQSQASAWHLSGLLWFLWFDYFLPERSLQKEKQA